MLRFAVNRVATKAFPVRAMATQATTVSTADFEAVAALLDSDEGRRSLANIKSQFLESQARLAEITSEAGPKIDWAELRKNVDPALVQAHDEALKSITWPKFDNSATIEDVRKKFEAFQKEAAALSAEAEKAVADIDREVAKTERIKEKVSSMTIDEYLEEFPEAAKKIDAESVQHSLMP
ncbi:hypothetical protein ACKKBG_A21360 [Auxenochlorella protothecoides x Auxenochlorella symbiontica]